MDPIDKFFDEYYPIISNSVKNYNLSLANFTIENYTRDIEKHFSQIEPEDLEKCICLCNKTRELIVGIWELAVENDADYLIR